MGAVDWPMLTDVSVVSDRLQGVHDRAEPIEILKITDECSAIIVSINETDYVLTMSPTPKQRPRVPKS